MTLPIVKPVLGTVVGLQSLALVGIAAQPLKDAFTLPKKGQRIKPMNFKKQTGNMIKSGVALMVGIPLVGATAGMVNKL